ncbi:transposase domain-containing protein [Nonomuraea helvata]|uniref:Transposase domain-containing protein n=1 Tax=Nonomuraea helvata TaxID=37484 RepID=A0ABV5SH21_9ACTN
MIFYDHPSKNWISVVPTVSRFALASAIDIAASSATAAGVFAAGHVGELTRIVPFEMVDAVLAEAGGRERRVRALPSRVVVYLLLAAGRFAGMEYRQVWARLVAGLDDPPGVPSSHHAVRRSNRRSHPPRWMRSSAG